MNDAAETNEDTQNGGKFSRLPQWVWAVAGFFGVLLVAGIFVAINRPKATVQPKLFAGQAVTRKGARPGEKEMLIEFKSSDPDPKNWYFRLRRQMPDGNWSEELKIPYNEYVSTKTDTELIFTSDDAQRKP